ncbi:MAG: segregation/condensation protein A [Candidatus Nanopelagicaceae bacterium]|nr:segregation/condensation protein A [Candidatus Nanopelagicaceae bacterium]
MNPEIVEPSSNTLGSLPPIVGATTVSGEGRVSGFSVHLDNFDGPFDLLLQLISRHRMDITDVAIATVTDEFISYIRELEKTEAGWHLDQATEFLVVAATLLDLKAARLLPSGEIEDEEDLALLEARDLLFARLLQYRAFKEIASILDSRITQQERSFARSVALDPVFSALLPEVLIGVTPERFAAIANRVLTPKTTPTLSVEHLHLPLVSVAAEALNVVSSLRRHKTLSFRTLVSDAENTLVVVARFLALLELYKDGSVRFEQVVALGELQITWTGSEAGEVSVSDEFDRITQEIPEDKDSNQVLEGGEDE